jgi:hypothetical protein
VELDKEKIVYGNPLFRQAGDILHRKGRQLISLLLVVFGIAFGPVCSRIGNPLAGGQVVLQTRVFIWAIQLTCILVGIFLFRADTSRKRQNLRFSIVLVMLMIVFIEAVLQVATFLFGLNSPKTDENTWYLRPPYLGQSWAKTLSDELDQVPVRFTQFLLWEKSDFHGQYVNIDSQGARKTWNPEPSADKPRKTVWMFGGSTLYGYGARDDYTIASYLSRSLSQSGRYSWKIENFGQQGYKFCQEVCKLIMLLRKGQCPDYIIFYDGINDVYSAAQSGKAGNWQNSTQIRAKVESQLSPTQHLILGLKGYLVRYCRIYQAIGKIGSYRKQPVFQENAARYSDSQLEQLAKDVGRDYLDTFQLLDRLSKAYGFGYICFLQPVLLLEKNVVEDVSDRAFIRFQDSAQRKLYELTYAYLDQNAPKELVNIADALSDRKSPIYIDVYHLSEEGNEMIAGRIHKAFVSRFNPDQNP